MTKPASPQRLLLQCVALALLLIAGVFLLSQAAHRFGEATYPLHYAETVEVTSQTYGIPPSLLYAVIHTESGFDPLAVSSAGAKGLMQITDDTYLWTLQRSGAEETYDPNRLFDPHANIDCGGNVLALLRERFPDTVTLLAAYNAGQGHVSEWLDDPAYSKDGSTLATIPYPETKTYVERVLTARQQYQNLYNLE